MNKQDMRKRLSDYECTGRFCEHETSEKHYIILQSDFEQEIKLALQEQQEEIIRKIESWNPEHWNEQSKTECRDDIISLIKESNTE